MARSASCRAFLSRFRAPLVFPSSHRGQRLMRQVPSWLASMVIHMTALLVVASISLHVAHSIQPSVVVTTPSEPAQFDDRQPKATQTPIARPSI
jgi:hypothetical protein